jgi:hypothetical protein
MSRKSVIQLVPAPTGRGDASDLRYRLLMAALGSSDEVNPLLVAPDAPHDADEPAEADTAAESAPAHANQNGPSAEPRAVERSGVAGLEGHPSLSLVRPQAASPQPVRNTGNETGAPAGAGSLPCPPKRR